MTHPERPDPRDPAPPLDFTEPPIDLSDLRWGDAIVLAVFWGLAFVVFLQFFTRYVLNNSLGWTEEIARFLLIAVTFIGAVMAVRKQSHIAVEFLYRWLPRPVRRICQSLIDAVSLVFFAALTWFSIQLAQRTQQMMVSIDVPKSLVYWGVAVCFGFMALYAARAGWRHLRSGTSRLVDPERHVEPVRQLE